jgi:hypothetical protein
MVAYQCGRHPTQKVQQSELNHWDQAIKNMLCGRMLGVMWAEMERSKTIRTWVPFIEWMNLGLFLVKANFNNNLEPGNEWNKCQRILVSM